MRFNTFKKYPFTADLWDYTVTQDAGGIDIRTYFFVRSGQKLDIKTDMSTRLLVLFEDTDLRPGVRLKNLVDAKGQELFVGGTYQLTTVEPIINMFGVRESYRSRGGLVTV